MTNKLNYSLINDDLVSAGVLIQNMKAELLDQPELAFNRLSYQARDEILGQIVEYTKVAHDIKSAEGLHKYNCESLLSQGWFLGPFSAQEKTTPLISDFDALPAFVQGFVRSCYVILKQFVWPYCDEVKSEVAA